MKSIAQPGLVLLLVLPLAPATIHAQTVGPVQLVVDINEDPRSGNQGTGDAYPKEFFEWRGILYFSANGGVKHGGREPWRSDGTAAGTFPIADLGPGARGSNPEKFMAAGDLLYFTVDDPNTPQWRVLYAWTGTRLLGPLTSFQQHGSVEVMNFEMGGRLYFTTLAGRTATVYATDGKSIDTTGFSSFAYSVVPLGSKLLMRWFGELGVSDGTATGIKTIDIYPGPTWSSPNDLTVIDGLCYFTAREKKTDRRHLWVTNGEKSGTRDLTPKLYDDLGCLSPGPYVNGSAFFSLVHPRHGAELWRSDGTVNGTEMIKDLHPTKGSNPHRMTLANRGVFFFATSDTRRGLYFTQGNNNFVRHVQDLGRIWNMVSISEETAIYVAEEIPNRGRKAFLTQRSYPYWSAVPVGNVAAETVSRAGNYVFFRGSHATLGLELFAAKIGATTTNSGPGYGANQARPSLRLSDPKISQPIEFSGTRAPAPATMLVAVGAPGYGAKLGPCPVYLDPTQPFVSTYHQVQNPSWRFSVPAPNMPALIGMQLAVQAVFLQPQLMSTNGLLVYPGR